MHWIDIAIVVAVFLVLGFIAVKTRRYTRNVADYLAANRCAGRYLLTMADGMAGMGAIAVIGSFQQYYEAGFAGNWWGHIMAPVGLILTLTGFIAYRFRESRVMTIAEFYELRYSRRFRIYAGILAWVSGVINYGVFPSVTARFFIYVCGIPSVTVPLGPFTADVTLGIVMAALLSIALTITFRGGQIAIMVTDFLQAQYLNLVFLALLGVLFWKIGWGDLISVLSERPSGQSLLNPFDQAEVPDFNVWFFVMGAFNIVYTCMAWQGNQGYFCSARTPHDAKMARILGMWRFGVTWMVISLIPMFAHALLHSASFTAEAEGVHAALATMDEGLQRQLTVPLALRQMLPVGMFGLFVAAMLAAAVSTDDTYLHSWGSIFIQDVVLPLRGRPLEPDQHLKWLRRSIFGVAAFVWVFGMLFPLQEYIFMYWAITGAIYTGGAGSVIIGGFYWKRGTTAGAWTGMTVGSVLAVSGIVLNNIVWPRFVPYAKTTYTDVAWVQHLPDTFWLNGMQLFVLASCCAIAGYVLVSLMTRPAPDFDLDRILHRGKYAIEGEHETQRTGRRGLLALLGVDEEYTRFDTFLALFLFSWTIGWFIVFALGTLYGLRFETTDGQWANWWLFTLVLNVTVGMITIIWFLWGGFRDLFSLFRLLRQSERADNDDGVVRHGAENS